MNQSSSPFQLKYYRVQYFRYICLHCLIYIVHITCPYVALVCTYLPHASFRASGSPLCSRLRCYPSLASNPACIANTLQRPAKAYQGSHAAARSPSQVHDGKHAAWAALVRMGSMGGTARTTQRRSSGASDVKKIQYTPGPR